MAQYNTLKEFTTDIAVAIREKTGGGQLIRPQDFASEIRALRVLGDECDCLIYFNNTKPASKFGGTWEELPQGTFLEATGSGGAAGTSKEAGLPNIKGSISIVRSDASTSLSDGDARLFTKTVVGSPSDLSSHPTIGSYSGQQPDLLTFDASKSNGIYKDGVTTVQPKSTTAHIWRKVS